jgi:release factor glutamine methyltransferase
MSTTTEQVWTLGSLLDWTAKHLAAKGVDTARLDAEVLLAHVVGCKRIDLYGMRYAEPASADVKQQFRELIRRRLEGCPVAYLVGR